MKISEVIKKYYTILPFVTKNELPYLYLQEYVFDLSEGTSLDIKFRELQEGKKMLLKNNGFTEILRWLEENVFDEEKWQEEEFDNSLPIIGSYDYDWTVIFYIPDVEVPDNIIGDLEKAQRKIGTPTIIFGSIQNSDGKIKLIGAKEDAPNKIWIVGESPKVKNVEELIGKVKAGILAAPVAIMPVDEVTSFVYHQEKGYKFFTGKEFVVFNPKYVNTISKWKKERWESLLHRDIKEVFTLIPPENIKGWYKYPKIKVIEVADFIAIYKEITSCTTKTKSPVNSDYLLIDLYEIKDGKLVHCYAYTPEWEFVKTILDSCYCDGKKRHEYKKGLIKLYFNPKKRGWDIEWK